MNLANFFRIPDPDILRESPYINMHLDRKIFMETEKKLKCWFSIPSIRYCDLYFTPEQFEKNLLVYGDTWKIVIADETLDNVLRHSSINTIKLFIKLFKKQIHLFGKHEYDIFTTDMRLDILRGTENRPNLMKAIMHRDDNEEVIKLLIKNIKHVTNVEFFIKILVFFNEEDKLLPLIKYALKSFCVDQTYFDDKNFILAPCVILGNHNTLMYLIKILEKHVIDINSLIVLAILCNKLEMAKSLANLEADLEIADGLISSIPYCCKNFEGHLPINLESIMYLHELYIEDNVVISDDFIIKLIKQIADDENDEVFTFLINVFPIQACRVKIKGSYAEQIDEIREIHEEFLDEDN